MPHNQSPSHNDYDNIGENAKPDKVTSRPSALMVKQKRTREINDMENESEMVCNFLVSWETCVEVKTTAH